MNRYNWQQSDWPNFHYDLADLHEPMLTLAEKIGYLSGTISHLSRELRQEALINLLVEEAIKTSAIEGEQLNRIDVRSSIMNQLKLHKKFAPVHDKRAQGIAELMLNARQSFQEKLTEETLFDWHLMLLSHSPYLRVGHWRIDEEPMQIISNQQGRMKVHFEAPPAKKIPDEMKQFIKWFNETAPGKPKAIPFAAVRAAITHLYFESIHPFVDGNGRIGRALAEKALSQGLGYPILLSLSQAIESDKKAYYTALHIASKSNEITRWITYFIQLIQKAQNNFEKQIDFVLKKTKLFDQHQQELNERELKVIKRMLEAGVAGFEGGMNAKKYMTLTKTSKATATRDLQHLASLGILKPVGSGRSTRYELVI